jgi:hypothetical protein
MTVREVLRAKTWWGKRTTAINIGLVIAVLLFIVWKSLFP